MQRLPGLTAGPDKHENLVDAYGSADIDSIRALFGPLEVRQDIRQFHPGCMVDYNAHGTMRAVIDQEDNSFGKEGIADISAGNEKFSGFERSLRVPLKRWKLRDLHGC